MVAHLKKTNCLFPTACPFKEHILKMSFDLYVIEQFCSEFFQEQGEQYSFTSLFAMHSSNKYTIEVRICLVIRQASN